MPSPNGVYVGAVNRVGWENGGRAREIASRGPGLEFWGAAPFIADPFGPHPGQGRRMTMKTS